VIAGSYSGMNVPANINRSACYIGYRPDTATDLSGYDEIRFLYKLFISVGLIYVFLIQTFFEKSRFTGFHLSLS
jgi:hypothetical protein